jgi:Carboxypeptidase regulatory-like domain/TonB dependent receptor
MLYFTCRSLGGSFIRLRNLAIGLTLLILLSQQLLAQTGTATLSGTITDQQGAALSNVRVTVTDEDTGISIEKQTNDAGVYDAPGLNPGRYRVLVTREGFMQVDVRDITLNVQDAVSRNFTLQVGGTSETLQVNGSGININTTDATVGTVIDRQFVENIPLNGRSFQSLILLSPGVVTGTPQGGEGNNPGEFSVNGQRTDANYYTLDGLSVNSGGLNVTSSAGSAGMAPASTGLGTTQAILSVDALQEFRIATSTYSAEYGRQPGAQISLQSRSGTNEYHGTAFDYLRNYAFDANNWFNNYSTNPIQKPQERQNDFGGVLGGPLTIPKLFSGKDRAFLFFSYEGLRLTQPAAATIYYVPSNGTYNTASYSNPLYKNVRANAPAALQPVLNAFPLPNCSTLQDPQCVDYGDGLSPFIVSSSSPSSIDAISARGDFQVTPWLRLFARYSDTQSRITTAPSSGVNISKSAQRTRFYTLGASSPIRASITNEIRLQYSPVYTLSVLSPGSFGGAQAANLWNLQGLPAGGESTFQLAFPGGENAVKLYQISYGARSFQPNAIDTLTWSHANHLFKAGVDYRQTTAYFGDGYLSRAPDGWYEYDDADGLLQNIGTSIQAINFQRQDPTSKNLGLFFQDEWRVRPRLSLSLGLRWDLAPPPAISGGQQYTYTGNINRPSSLALSRQGAPLYGTTYHDVAPRFGIAATLHDQPGHELVLRGGGGLFYDIGQPFFLVIGDGEDLGVANYQNLGTAYNKPQGFPVPASVILAPVPAVTPPYSLGYVVDPHLVPPSTIQWSASMEQALGQGQSISLGYVGSQGRNLITEKVYTLGALNPLFSAFEQYQNGPGSNYNALQLQYRRAVLHGLQVQAAYTWAHAIDSKSSDATTLPPQRGNSDFDVRNNFNAALVYSVPSQYNNHWQRATLGYWELDLRFVARSAFPVQATGPVITDPVSGAQEGGRLNYNGQNPYVYKRGIPGARQFNPAVFSAALASQNGDGDSPRNFLRGFGETQADTAVQRTFPLYEQLHLLFRAEAFNIFNHPNFGTINVSCGTSVAGATCTNPLMGQSTNTLSNSSVAFGGLASIYQQGGPRSLQFALKLQF